MPPTYLMLLWHMHQPFYKDLAEGQYAMPWVRLHALKDYYGMVAMLEEFPNVHVTFNLVPSLLAQIGDYARDAAQEREFQLAFKPALELTVPEREFLLASAFQVNRENLLNRLPRFRELWAKSRAADRSTAAKLFSTQEFLELQVLSQLAWFDELYLDRDPEIKRLVEMERGYSEEDKSLLRNRELEIFKVIIEAYRKAEARGQIEISTSAFYHPILPLLCDTEVATESHPGVRLPKRRFHHPEDAAEQLRAAVVLHERLFGHRPRGLWPSEGGVSDEALRLAIREGFEWAASDEGVLARTLGRVFAHHGDGGVEGGEELYRPHTFEAEGGSMRLFFRDHQLSDLIGFVYSRMDAGAAAADLHQRIRSAGQSAGNGPAVVSVIVDGENAWEYYPGNGREFLKSFYGRLAGDPAVQAVTASEAARLVPSAALTRLTPGSWINANFDIWIGAEEDNRAWELLGEARGFYAASCQRAGLESEAAKLAQQEIWIAEGSDWCWWYGPEHSTANDEDFDLLYRKHLSNIYRLLGASPPDELATPIKRPRTRALEVAPSASLEPRIDGEVTNYFEWLGAGLYVPAASSGAMHGAAQGLEALYYGYSAKALYLRLDLSESFRQSHPDFEVRVTVVSQGRARLHVRVKGRGAPELEFAPGEDTPLAPLPSAELAEVAWGRVFELRGDFALLGLVPHVGSRLQVSIWANELPLQVIPEEGWLDLQITEQPASW